MLIQNIADFKIVLTTQQSEAREESLVISFVPPVISVWTNSDSDAVEILTSLPIWSLYGLPGFEPSIEMKMQYLPARYSKVIAVHSWRTSVDSSTMMTVIE